MAKTKLILVEGLPGSGKTSMAEHLHLWLNEQALPNHLYLEGDLDHPADYESVACLEEDEFEALAGRFPTFRNILEERSQRRHGERLIGYRKLGQELGDVIPTALIDALARYEIYEQPPAKYRRLIAGGWQAFTRQAAESGEITIFECCFLQNPLTMLLGRCDETIPEAQAFVLELAEIIGPLNPALVYLQPVDAGETLRGVAQRRPPEWLDFVIAYHTRQGYGKAHGWHGIEGLIQFYEMRREVELQLLPNLPWPSTRIVHQDWEQDRQRARSFITWQLGEV